MAPIEPDVINSNTRPLALFFFQAAISIALLAAAIRFLFLAHYALPPAKHTRIRHATEKQKIPIFLGLAALSLFVTTYLSVGWRVASYAKWAHTHDFDIPNVLWKGPYAQSLQNEALLLGRWMEDVSLWEEFGRTAILAPRAFWWTQQHLVGLTGWSLFVSIQGHHRNIPRFYTFGFVLLAQFVGLSPAMNLFFVTVILTPVPYLTTGSSVLKKSTPTSIPPPLLLLLPALFSLVSVSQLPTMAKYSTRLWPVLTNISYSIIPLLITAIAQVDSLNSLSDDTSTHRVRSTYRIIFRVYSISAFALHFIQSVLLISNTAPTAYQQQKNYIWNTQGNTDVSIFERTWTVVAQILSSLHDDPIVSLVAWDVLLSGISLCIWAAMRGLTVRAITSSLGLSSWKTSSSIEGDSQSSKPDGDSTGLVAPSPTRSPPKKSRGRSRKNTARKQVTENITSANGYSPRQSTKNRSTPAATGSGDEDVKDEDFQPLPEARQLVVITEDGGTSDSDLIHDTESGAVAWTAFILGGLGTEISGVLGGEICGR